MAGGTSTRGRCFCGSVTFVAGPAICEPMFCHCESCRRASGAHAVGWVTVQRDTLSYLGDAVTEYESSPGIVRGHCARCGTSLTYFSDARPDEIDVTLASLDDPAGYAPADHIWMEDAQPWDRPADGRAQYPRSRPR